MSDHRPPPYVLIGAAVAIAITVGYWFGSGQAPTKAPPLDAATQVRAALESPAVSAEKQAEQIALAKNQLRTAFATGTTIAGTVDALAAESERWTSEIEPLLTNRRGALLTADDKVLLAVDQAFTREKPTRAEAAAAKTRVADLLKPMRLALDDPTSTYVASSELMRKLDLERVAAEKGLQAYQGAREQVTQLLADAERTSVQPRTATLREGIDALHAAAAAEAKRKSDAERDAREAAEARRQASTFDENLLRRHFYAVPLTAAGKDRYTWRQTRLSAAYNDFDTWWLWAINKDWQRHLDALAHQKVSPSTHVLWDEFRALVEYREDLFLTADEESTFRCDYMGPPLNASPYVPPRMMTQHASVGR